MIFSGDVPWRKPNPEFMWAAARELGVDPGECLVVGDSLPADVAGAKAAGIPSVWINRDGAVAPADGARPDWEVTSLGEVAGIATGA
jgi:FMN phosphatase YigB (HAD superfamily)